MDLLLTAFYFTKCELVELCGVLWIIVKFLSATILKNKGASRSVNFCLNGSIKYLSVSQKVICGESRFFRF